jgi:sulfite oxidase
MELPAELDTTNRPDEWKIEQGMAGHKLPILDQSGSDTGDKIDERRRGDRIGG